MRRICLTISYCGIHYAGWAKQKNLPSVQETVEKALKELISEHVSILGSSRTDAGVHAFCQIAAFSTKSTIPAEKFTPALNRFLPNDVRIVKSEEVRSDFDPIRNTIRKKYVYFIDDGRIASPFLAGRVWTPRFGDFDHEKMHEAAQFLVGTHDFVSFQDLGSPRCSTVRTIFQASVTRNSDPLCFHHSSEPLIKIEIEGSGFLYHSVRIITGTLVKVGKLDFPPEWVQDVLVAKNRALAGPTAPPDGLYLEKIDVTF